MTEVELRMVLQGIVVPFWKDWAFWIGTVLGVLGVGLSGLAFAEARQAKIAARQAGRVVKLQTIVVELTEIAQRLEQLDGDLDYRAARNLLSETSRRLHRLIAAYRQAPHYEPLCAGVEKALTAARDALDTLRPGVDEDAGPVSVYFAMERHFAGISDRVAEILGLFEADIIGNAHERQRG